MKEKIRRIVKFLTDDIWKYDTQEEINAWKERLTVWLKTLMVAGRIIWKDEMMTIHVPALTFSTLMAFVPLFAMMFVIARGLGSDSMLEEWIKQFFASQPVVAETLVQFVHNYLANTQSNYIVGVGLIMMFYTLCSLMSKIESVFNSIWQAKDRKPLKMISDYTVFFIAFGCMIIVASVINVCEMALINDIEYYTGLGDEVKLLLQPVAIVPMTLFFTFLFCSIPNTLVKIRCAIVPGLISATLTVMLQYYYFLIQVWVSSYNIIYGSFAALPLFLLWLQITWIIILFGAVLTFAIQNLHHFDLNVQYGELRHDRQIEICTAIMERVCEQFKVGGEAFTAVTLQKATQYPQQIINSALDNLLAAKLLVEIKSDERGTREELSQYHPIEAVSNLTRETVIRRIESYGKDL